MHKKWDYVAARFYLSAIMLSVLRDLYALYTTYLRKIRNQKQDGSQTTPTAALLVECLRDSPEASLDLIRNISDFPIPGSKLGYFPNHNGLVGLFGLVSSVIGAYQVAYPYMKLRP